MSFICKDSVFLGPSGQCLGSKAHSDLEQNRARALRFGAEALPHLPKRSILVANNTSASAGCFFETQAVSEQEHSVLERRPRRALRNGAQSQKELEPFPRTRKTLALGGPAAPTTLGQAMQHCCVVLSLRGETPQAQDAFLRLKERKRRQAPKVNCPHLLN